MSDPPGGPPNDDDNNSPPPTDDADPLAFSDDEADAGKPAAPPADSNPADPLALADLEADAAKLADLAVEKAKRPARQKKAAQAGEDAPAAGNVVRLPRREMPYRVRPLPAGCPVVPLGMSGSTRWYLDAAGQLQGLVVARHLKLDIQGLFCAQADLVNDYWLRINAKTGRPDGWHPERAAADLLAASGARLWSPTRQVRGRGCWLDDEGGLVVHAGDAVWHSGEWRPPGVIEGKVYPAGDPVMRPAAADRPGRLAGPGQALLDLFNCWRFERAIDARLLIGQLGANFAGAALPWRAIMWLWGESQAGKSTLSKTFEALSGGWLLSSVDTTAAGIWQRLDHDSLPLALDEAGDDIDARRSIALLRLIRVLAGGGAITRGGGDHQGRRFELASCLLLSSIALPPLLIQDATRIATIRLLQPKALLPQPAPAKLQLLGAEVFHRVLDAWPRLQPAIDTYVEAFAAVVGADRVSRIYSCLLGLAHVILSDHDVEPQKALEHVMPLVKDLAEQAQDVLSSGEAWRSYTLSKLLPFDGGGDRKTVFEWLRQALFPDAGEQPSLPEVEAVPASLRRSEAERVLRQVGIVARRPNLDPVTAIALANDHAGLTRLYENTPWAGAAGRKGGWIAAARSLDGAEPCKARFLGLPTRGTSIPLSALFGENWNKDSGIDEKA